MCSVRGELCIVSRPSRLLYKLRTSFGYAWAQMLCSMPEEHVRDGRLQVSNIALNFRQHDTTNISLPLVPCSQDANEHSKQSEITQTLSIVAATERKKEKKQKHKPLLFSNKSWECGGGWGRKRFWDEANWKVFFLYFVVSRSLPHFPNEEKMNKGKWNLMDSQIKIYVFFSSPLFFTKKRIILRHVVLFSMVNFQVFSLLRLSLSPCSTVTESSFVLLKASFQLMLST